MRSVRPFRAERARHAVLPLQSRRPRPAAGSRTRDRSRRRSGRFRALSPAGRGVPTASPAMSPARRAAATAKQRENVLDYDDLLLYWADMMEEPALPRLVGERFDHILVDEYQDTNALQAQI